MKIVKLPKRYILGDAGFNYALRFENECTQSTMIRVTLNQLYGEPWSYWNRYRTGARWGYWKDYKRRGSPLWIGVKDEADLTVAILMTSASE